jgi:hypothetical protein
MMRQEEEEEEDDDDDDDDHHHLYRATVHWYWEVKSISDFRVTWEELCVSRK